MLQKELVMPGLEPGIQGQQAQCKSPLDCRVKPGNDVVVYITANLFTLDAHGDAHAATDAQRGETFLGIALLHLMQQRDEDARA